MKLYPIMCQNCGLIIKAPKSAVLVHCGKCHGKKAKKKKTK